MSTPSVDRSSSPSRASLSVSRRLGLGFVVLLLAQLLIGLLGLQALTGLRADLDRAEGLRLTRLGTAQELQDGIAQIGLLTRSLAWQDSAAQLALDARLLAQEQARVQHLERVLLDEADWPAAQRSLIDATASAGAAARPLIDAAARMGREGQNREAVQQLLQQVRPAETQWRQHARRLSDALLEQGRLAAQEARERQERAIWLLCGVTLACLLAGAAMAWMLVRGIRQPVDQAVRLAESLIRPAGPEPVPAVSPGDEFDRLQRAMASVQKRLREGVAPLAAPRRAEESAPVANPFQPAAPAPFGERPVASGPAAVPPLPSRADREVAAANVPMFGSTVPSALSTPPRLPVQSAGSAVTPQSLVNNAVRVAERGSEVVTQVVSNLEDISASSRKINEILATIDGIAFQTNILALNAAVQAARAGQENTGFGVVAGEVRALAQRAASAAREIKGLINASVEKAESGTRLVRDAGATMDAIVSSVQGVTELVGQITGKAGEQAAGQLAEADLSVQRLDHLTQQNAALVEQSASAADALRQQAERLQKVVGAFRLLQQTQEAAWTAHTAIHSARSTSRGDTQPGGLDPLGGPGSAGKGTPPAKPGGEGEGWSNF